MRNWCIATLLLCVLSIIGENVSGEKRIIVLMVGNNARQYIESALRSVYEQRYSNYQLFYIDCSSSDGSLHFVHEYTANMGKNDHLFACINGSPNKHIPLNSYVEARSFLKDEDIVMVLSPQDWLAHQNVFSYLNSIYAEENLLMTYGPVRLHPSNELLYNNKIPDIVHECYAYKNYLHIPHFMHTCRGILLKNIRKGDFYSGDNFLDTGDELVCTLPMLQMANGHIRFVQNALVIRNTELDNTRHILPQEKQDEINVLIRNYAFYRSIGSL